MNPASTLRFRRITAYLAAGWALLAIGLSIYTLIGPSLESALPLELSLVGGISAVESVTEEAGRAGIEPGDRLRAIDGVPVRRIIRWGPGFLHPEVPNVYEIEKPDGRVSSVSLYPVTGDQRSGHVLLQVCLLLVSCLYLSIGGGIWWTRQPRAEAWALLLFCSMMAVELATAVSVDLIPWSAARALANLPLLGATTFHLFTTYPIEPDFIVRRRRIRMIPYLIAFLLAHAVLGEEMIGMDPEWITGAAFFYGIGLCLFSVGILARQRGRALEAGVGDRVDMMLLAAVVSFVPALISLVAQYFLHTPFPWYVAMLWVALFPIAVGGSMLRKQLFEFRSVARSSAAYTAAGVAVTGVFAFLITTSDLIAPLIGVTERAAQVAFLFLAILAFNPLRDRTQRLVDSLFDRDGSRYRSAIQEISEAMVSMLSLREIDERILVALTDTMGVGRAIILYAENDEVLRPSTWRGDWDHQDVEIEIPGDHAIRKHLWMRREELSRADFDDEIDAEQREACWDVFDTLEVELLVPILFGVDLLGVIAVGRKHSGERLTSDDRQLLRTLANNSSIAIENAKVFAEVGQLNETLEARVEERTKELRETQNQLMQAEKLKSMGQMVAGVAHELNNPISFVHANLQLLDEYIRKLVEGGQTESDTEQVHEAINKLLVRSREGTERVKKIVQNLRTFSRIDQAELQLADLHEEIDRTLGLMTPRFKGGISVVRNYGEIPQVRCYPGRLNQVFLNLLMNACDALGTAGTVTITTSRHGSGVRLVFQDDGPGIEPEVQGRLFDPFFTTKPVGQGTGLGLSLSHGIIEEHGGRIFVSSELGKGASFVIDLPLDATAADE